MTIYRFEDIIAWQKSQLIAVEIYKIFGNTLDYTFKNQICRSVVSISNNIAEGFERRTDTDILRFLYISLGSCSETKSMLYLAKNIGYINEDLSLKLIFDISEIARLIKGLIHKISRG